MSSTLDFGSSLALSYYAVKHGVTPRRHATSGGGAAPPPHRFDIVADLGAHWLAGAAWFVALYPLVLLAPQQQGEPPRGFDRDLDVKLLVNDGAVSHFPQPDADGVTTLRPSLPDFGADYAPAHVHLLTDGGGSSGSGSGGALACTLIAQNPSGERSMVYVLDDGVTVVVAFAGTVTPAQWAADVTVAPVEWAVSAGLTVGVHSGALAEYTALATQTWADAAAKLAALAGTAGLNLLITGHSLGGACAEIGALDFAVNRATLAPGFDGPWEVHTAAAPAIADANFVTAFASRVPVAVRLVIEEDPVPIALGALYYQPKGLLLMPLPSQDSIEHVHNSKTYVDAVSAWTAGGATYAVLFPIVVAGIVVTLLLALATQVAPRLRRRHARSVAQRRATSAE